MGKKQKKSWGGKRKGAGPKFIMKNAESLAVQVPASVLIKLKREASKEEKTVSAYVREILTAAKPDLPW